MAWLKSFFVRQISLSSSMHEWLMLSSSFSVALLFVRMIVTGSTEFIFLGWNLILAFIPYFISRWLARKTDLRKNKITLMLMMGLLLLFMPNSFYIMTDLFHLSHFGNVPRWFDLVMLFSFTWNGLLAGIISLRRAETIISSLKNERVSVFVVWGAMVLNAFGMYIGRYLRYNSWDVLTDPVSLFAEIADIIFHPLQNFPAWGMTFCYSIFMTLLYYSIVKMSQALKVESSP